MHTPAATLSVTSPCPSPSSAAQIARKTAGSRSPPVSGISAKKPRGSVTTRCQVAAKVRAPAARASGSGKAMGRPYSGGTPGGPGRARRRADALVLRDAAGRMRARHAGPALLVGAGKAALAMARAADAAARGLVRGGVLVVPHAAVAPAADDVAVLGGGHPLPDRAGAAARRRADGGAGRARARRLERRRLGAPRGARPGRRAR